MAYRVLFAILCIMKVIFAQMNGEFWWLHDKVKNLHGGEIMPAKFEDLNEFDNDEYDTIVFENDKENEGFVLNANNSNRREGKQLEATESGSLSWPDDTQFDFYNDIYVRNQTVETIKDNKDEFTFHFPDTNKTRKDLTNKTNTSNLSPSKLTSEIVLDKLIFKPNQEFIQHAEPICSNITEEECIIRNGSIYNYGKSLGKRRRKKENSTIICCVLPLDDDDPWTKIYFPDSEEISKHRAARSTSGELDKALNQRKALLFKSFDGLHTVRTTTPKQVTKRIVSPDEDDEDPYENIRNPIFRPRPKPNKKPSNSASENAYGSQQDYEYYDNVYSEEVPKPSLTGLYSDNGQNHGQATWTKPIFNAEDSEENVSAGYGSSTADPRIDYRKPIAPRKPIKCKTTPKVSSISEESTYETGSQTITFHANPDFQVLQGFKLLNLVENRNRAYSKHSRKTTAESKSDDDEEMEADDDYTDFIDQDKQVYSECGKSAKVQSNYDTSSGKAHHKSHPWLCLVSRSRRQQSTLCHATLVHPRAAITAANCVYGASSGEVIVYAGVWDLNDDPQKNQQRMASVHVHPRYSPGSLKNDLAILHWPRALRVGITVQPACLADPRVGDSCAFVGWGGHGQAVQNTPRLQRASILTPRECNSCSTKQQADKFPAESFCASVNSKGCVTGVGGSLVCGSSGRQASVGVVIWRETCDVTSPHVLLPAHEWTIRALSTLNIIQK